MLIYLRLLLQQRWHHWQKSGQREKMVIWEFTDVFQQHSALLNQWNRNKKMNKILTPWRTVFLDKLTGPKLVKNFPAFYGTRRFITAVTKARTLSLTWNRSVQSMPPSHFLKINFNFEVILTVHRRYYVEIKYQLDATDDIYCRFYCMLNMFRAILCPSSGAREYYTAVLLQQPANRTHNLQLHITPTTCKPKHQIPQAATICIILSSSWWWA